VPRDGEPVVLRHPLWDINAILAALDCEDTVSYEWPHPPRGRHYSVYHRFKESETHKGLSLVHRAPSLVLAHDGQQWRSLNNADMTYLGFFVVMEQSIIALAGSPQRAELEGGDHVPSKDRSRDREGRGSG